jgi:nicotinate phosphoribosyltransferase
MTQFSSITGTYTDLYQLTMGQVYYRDGRQNDIATFDYFFRKIPFNGGYVVFAGLRDVLDALSDLHFTADELEFLKSHGFESEYIDYLRDFRFTGTVYSAKEGDIVFPTQPVVTVEGNIIEAQIVETLLLNMLNFQSLIATKAARIRWVAGDRTLVDFGLRRAHGLGGYHASRAAIIGGFDSTSNVKAAMDFDLPVSGTMAHAFIQSFDDELTAFRHYAEGRPENCLLLVDTYNTLESGIPNAIKVAREMEKRGHHLAGIRLDSGDLAYLSKRARHMLDSEGLGYVKIAASNQLDEDVIKSLLEQEAPIDIFGVGTSLVTGQPDAALDGVYKLSFASGKPRIKLSESLKKTTLPEKKQVFRVLDSNGFFFGADAVGLHDEDRVEHMFDPFEPYKSLSLRGTRQEPLLHKVMQDGKILADKKSLKEIAAYCNQRLSMLPNEYKRFQNPHTYKVGISKALMNLRDQLKSKFEKS